jgi:biopolymer transport protein ExbD
MAMSGGRDDGQPMMEMNTTPLIDVMLVLLILIIMTIPMQNHSVDVDLPQSSNQPTNVDSVKNKIVLTPDNQILWDGQAITPGQLVANLNATKAMNPEPELQFEPDPQAPYDLAAKTIHIIKQSGVTKFGFVGNEKYRVFGK